MENRLTERDELKLTDAVKAAGDLVENGMAPNDAIVKVAQQHGLAPADISLVAFAYNNGAQLDQMKENNDVLSKFAEFALADPQVIQDKLYPKKQASYRPQNWEVADEYNERPPEWLTWNGLSQMAKTAVLRDDESTAVKYKPAPTPQRQAILKSAEIQRQKRAAEEARRIVSLTTDKLEEKKAQLVSYFKLPRSMRLDFATVKTSAVNRHGLAAAYLLDDVYERARCRDKVASDNHIIAVAIKHNDSPFSTLNDAIKLASDLYDAEVAFKAAEEQTKNDLMVPPSVEAPKPTKKDRKELDLLRSSVVSATDDLLSKEAFLGTPAFGAAIGSGLARYVGDMPKDKSDLVDEGLAQLEDPAHQNEMHRIKTHAMLNSMMTDEEDPISGYDPDTVMNAYNDISQMSPRISQQPAAVGPLLRRYLQGNLQPFESKELTELEKGFVQSRQTKSPDGEK